MKIPVVLIPAFVISLAACSANQPDSSSNTPDLSRKQMIEQAGAPLFEGMGDHSHAITTKEPLAQKFFDQGLTLSFGFNHAESIRSFRAAQKLDPDCAMCFWGEALATGPNINVTSNGKAIMSDDERKSAFAALQKALALKSKATQVEQDYIDALTSRYNGEPGTPREPLDMAYAEAMRGLAQKYPADDDATSLFAEALMNTMPWDYWLGDGKPKTATVEVIDTLEKVIARKPNHALALHLYIHATEASANPGRAEQASDTLANLVPGSGHLVHMPAHIYWRVGRYHDAAEANVKAAAVDEDYIAQCNAQGFYPALYYPHNIHFLWAAASMQGRGALAIESARKVAANVHLEQIEQFPTVEFFKTIPLLALTQFGHWDDILNEPQPPQNLDYSNAIWHYARGTALARKGDFEAAKAEQAALAEKKGTVKVRFLDSADYPASALLHIANELLLGEIAMEQEKLDSAIKHFTAAVAEQDKLPYMEPPFWYYPTRQSLGMALLKAKRNEEAEGVYKTDLQHYPRNGWSMFGLFQSLNAQGKKEEADEIQTTLDQVWSMADVSLTG